jgi:hypothetical protein
MQELETAGFTESATWRLGADGRPRLDGEMPNEPGLYLFVDDGVVCYIGVTSGTLHKRMRPYSRRLKNAIAGRPVYNGIETALRAGRDVKVYTLCRVNPRRGNWKGLPIDHLIGVEAALIENLNPLWNALKSATRKLDSDVIESEGEELPRIS